MTALAPRGPAALSTTVADPREQWPQHARRLYDDLVGIYGADDVLPTLAAGWVAHQRSTHTQRSYARGFRLFEDFAREHGTHPMAVRFGLADTFSMYLRTAPTWVPIKGGARGRWSEPGRRTPTLRGRTRCRPRPRSSATWTGSPTTG